MNALAVPSTYLQAPRAVQTALTALFAVITSFLVGCAVSPDSRTIVIGATRGAPMSGHVHGGQQPIAGAIIQLYAVSTSGDGTPASPLLSPGTLSNANGQFTLGAYTCPSANALVYITATQGNPGLAPGSNNPNSALMAALGTCGSLTKSTYVSINELTTVASAFPLAPFSSGFAAIGSSASDASNLAAAFASADEYINVATGTLPGPALPAGYSAPTAQIITLANVLSGCINSAGGASGDGSLCGTLFADATLSGLAPPTDTIGAALQMAKNPLLNVASIFDLMPSVSPYQPALSAAPFDWNISLQQPLPASMPQRSNLLGEYLLAEGQGSVAHDTSGQGNDGTIYGAAWEGNADLDFTNTPYRTGSYVSVPSALNQANTWEFAIYAPPYGYAAYPQAPGYAAGSDWPYNSSILCGTTQQLTCFTNTQTFATVSLHFMAYNTSSTEPIPALTAGWHIVTLVSGQAGQLDHIYYDGTEVSSYRNQGSGMFPHPISGNYQIGGANTYTGTWFRGKIAGAWAWSTSLSATDAARAASSALAFIQEKGAAPQYSPVIHTTPLVLGGVDSRTAGYGLVNQPIWANNLALSDPTYVGQALGIPGSSLYDHAAMFDLLEAPQIKANTAPTIEVLWGGINDFSSPNNTAIGVVASMQTLITKAKALGARVIVATEISNPFSESDKAAFDTLIRAQAFSWGADNVVDLATIPQIGADGANQTAYFYDGLHPSDMAEPLITAAFSNGVNELLGSTASAHHASSATTYTEIAGDNFLDLIGSASQTITLPDCIGYSLPRRVFNLGNVAASIATQNGETLSGSNAVGAASSATFTSIPGPYSTGGCSWQRTN